MYLSYKLRKKTKCIYYAIYLRSQKYNSYCELILVHKYNDEG